MTKFYGQVVGVDGLDLEVRRGEVYGFIGPNGAGKTTTMRVLLDLVRPTDGTVEVLGLDPQRDSLEVRSRVGYLPGDPAYDRRIAALRYLRYLASLRENVDARRIAELAERLDLDLSRPIDELSRGNRQKVGLVQAFMHDPELLVLDEPTSGLDPPTQRVFDQLVNEARAAGRTVFLSSHVLSEVERVADRVGMLNRGRMVQVADVREVTERAVRRIEVRFGHAVSASDFRDLAGVRTVEGSGERLVFVVEGSVNPLIKAIAAHEVVDIRTRRSNLEDVFMSRIQEEGSDA